MLFSRTYIILIGISFTCSAESTFSVKRITESIGTLLETPNWSVEEQALYFIDIFGNTFYRFNEETCKVTSRKIDCGSLGLITLLEDSPGYVILGINNSLYVANCNVPSVEVSLRLLTTVDLGKPDNNIHDGKADAAGRLWFGTFGKLLSATTIEPSQGSLYVITNETYVNPRVALRPVGLSDGLVWSIDNNKFYYNDGVTRKITCYDYNLKKGEIANGKTFFDFEENGIAGFPNGMTIDTDGNIWVATFSGKEVLRISAKTGKVLQKIKIPGVDLVTSIIWGGKNMDNLYATTGSYMMEKPKPGSGSLFQIIVEGCRGLPQNFMRMNDVAHY